MKKILLAVGLLTGTLILGACELSNPSGTTPPNNETPRESQTFESKALGFSFSYPKSWTGEKIEDEVYEQGVIFLNNTPCTEKCPGLVMTVRTGENYEYDYSNRLHIDFGLKEPGNDTTSQPSTASSEETSRPKPFQKDSFLVLKGGYLKKKDEVLHIYNNRDRIYIFEFRFVEKTPEEKEQIFNEILDGFKEIPVEKRPTPALNETLPEFAFDGCGSTESFSKEPFYNDFITKVGQMPSFPQAETRLYSNLMLTPADLADVCYSKAGNMLVALANVKRYCEFGGVLKYEIATGTLTYADDREAHRKSKCMSLQSLGRRRGRIIEVKGAFGDAGIMVESTYHYDYNQNVLHLKRACTTSFEENEKKIQKCENF